jgi:hypothetical protein
VSKNKFTHTGIMRGADARTPRNWQKRVQLRETKNFWVTSYNLKFRKSTGFGAGDWPRFCLDLESIKEIENGA